MMMAVILVTYDKNTLAQFLLFSDPIPYNEKITLYPVTMEHVLDFQMYSRAITFRKDSRIGSKEIIKMTYLDFLVYAMYHPELAEIIQDTPDISQFFLYTVTLLTMVCKDQPIDMNRDGGIRINGHVINADEFDDLRRIIILQNGIDFNIDEFLNYDTEKRLQKAQKDMDKNKDIVTTEDYIDSLCLVLQTSKQAIKEMPIREFWRLVKRNDAHETYQIMKTGECSGMVKFKEPIKHWVRSLEEEDKYAHLKTDENELKSKIG